MTGNGWWTEDVEDSTHKVYVQLVAALVFAAGFIVTVILGIYQALTRILA